MASDTSSLLRDAKKYMLGNYKPLPVVMDTGEGALIFDTNHKRYIDFASGIAVSSLGYGHQGLQNAITEQVHRLLHVSNSFLNQPAIELAAKLCKLSSLHKTFFCNSGAEANEAMLKLARRRFSQEDPGRFEIVCMKKAFHGRTLGTISATGQEKYRNGFGPLLPGFKTVEFGDFDAIERAVDKKTAAVILEPILGEGGILVPPAGYLTKVRELCDATGALLLLDEVQTGIARTGTFFACQQENVVPDAMALAKGLAGGLPIGAMLVHEKFADVLEFPSHGSTFGGNPVACASAQFVIDTVAKEEFLAHVRQASSVLLERLIGLKEKKPHIVIDVRGRGLLLGVQMKNYEGLRERALDRGLLTNFCGDGVLRIAPPLVISEKLIHEGVDILEELL